MPTDVTLLYKCLCQILHFLKMHITICKQTHFEFIQTCIEKLVHLHHSCFLYITMLEYWVQVMVIYYFYVSKLKWNGL